MNVSQLIKKLQEFDPNMGVCIFDYKKSSNEGDGSEYGSSAGCYGHFEVSLIGKDQIPKGTKPWVALSFSNPDLEN